MSTLETRIAEVVSEHRAGATNSVQTCCMCDSTWRTHADHDAHATAALAPVIREQEAEASAQAFQSVRDNAEYEPEERDGPNLIIAAYLMIDVDKLNALDKSHDGMDWVRYTATDYANALRKAQAEAWADGVQAGVKYMTEDTSPDNPYRSNDE